MMRPLMMRQSTRHPKASDIMPPVLAPAKVNLTLHVTGRRSDGYHLLDSIVAFADVGDLLTVHPGDGLSVTGPFAAGVPEGQGNIIHQALRRAAVSRSVVLDKRLPHPAGIGGGSSDAAAVLRAVGADLSMAQMLALGADVPVCTLARAARMQGIGDILSPVRMPPLHAVLVNPGVGVPTGAVFTGLSSVDGAGMDDLPGGASASGWIDWLCRQRNDLAAPACRVAPVIETVLGTLRDSGSLLVRMSGSGATCFGLYADRDAADRAAVDLSRPDWWVTACTLT